VTEPAPSAAEVEPRWGLGDVVIAFVFGLVSSSIVASVVLAATDRKPDQQDELPLSLVLITQLGLWLGLFGVPWLVTRVKGSGLVRDLRLRIEAGDLWRGAPLGAALQLVVIPLVYWPLLELLDRSTHDLEGPARELTDRADGAIGVILLVLIVGIGAPIVEEVFYRGFLQGALLKRGLPAWFAIGLTAVLFGLSHFELLQLPALVLFGLLAGVLAHRSRRLGPSIAAHLAFNMVTVIALLASSS
jgi:membrane protease YdiL (CAAX protease family)